MAKKQDGMNSGVQALLAMMQQQQKP